MDTIPSTMNHPRRKRFDHIRCCFLLLLASIATASFQGDGVSMFALAEQRTNNNNKGRELVRRPADLTDFANAAVLQLDKEVENTEDELFCEERTDEPVYIKKRNRRTRKRKKIELCQWVDKKRNVRCNRIVKKRKRNPDTDSEKRFVKVCYNPRKYCEDICEPVYEPVDEPVDEVIDEPVDEPVDVTPTTDVSTLPTEMSCPIEETDMEGKLGGKTCADYEIGQKCHYSKVNVGCTAATFRCMPLSTCTCKQHSVTLRDTWFCSTYLPPKDYYCPEAPRPRPADWEDPPIGLRQPCEMSDDGNTAEDEDNSENQLRRRGLRVEQ